MPEFRAANAWNKSVCFRKLQGNAEAFMAVWREKIISFCSGREIFYFSAKENSRKFYCGCSFIDLIDENPFITSRKCL